MSEVLSLAPRARRARAAGAPVATGRRPVVFDMSHLIARLRAQAGTGIDRIDLAYASHFFEGSGRSEAVRYGAGPPRLMTAAWAAEFTRAARIAWTSPESSHADAIWTWLDAAPGEAEKPANVVPSPHSAPAWGRRLLSWAGYVVGSARRSIPSGSVYINVGYHLFEHPKFFAWLGARSDVDGVFMIHDLLPLDYPEYFQPGESERFADRITTALRYGKAFLVSTEAVRRRLQREIAARGLEPRPIWARPFPSPLADFPVGSPRRTAQHPYFVVVGTIEPRKNHLLLLHIWRAMARSGVEPPRLVIVGARGWENEQVLDLLERSPAIQPYVAEVSGLSSRDLAELIAGARGLLAPSFEEGYGLPIVEALALGTPVIAAESEAAREVSQGRAQLLSPIHGEGWRRAIERLAFDDEYLAGLRARAAGFVTPNWRDYFASLDQFLAELPA